MTATLRHGEKLNVGEDVTLAGWHHTCEGVIFTILEITPHDPCESGTFILVFKKDEPDRLVKGSTGKGLDANWFKKVTNKKDNDGKK